MFFYLTFSFIYEVTVLRMNGVNTTNKVPKNEITHPMPYGPHIQIQDH